MIKFLVIYSPLWLSVSVWVLKSFEKVFPSVLLCEKNGKNIFDPIIEVFFRKKILARVLKGRRQLEEIKELNVKSN